MPRFGSPRPTAGLILGAGLGTRFGGRKLLAPIDGRPMLQHVLDLAADAGLAPVVVVLGTDAEEVVPALSWRDEVVVRNPEPEAGIAGSVRVGLRRLEATDAQRAVVLLGDQPFLSPEQLRIVLSVRTQIVVPRYDGQPGNPVLLDRSVWPLASRLEGDRGFSQIFAAYANLVTFVNVPGTNPDIDTVGDLAALPDAAATRDAPDLA
jgi:molybdenum cofactor cytidylyltransferase